MSNKSRESLALTKNKDQYTSLNKQLGQNFLTDNNILQKIVLAANVTPETAVLEIGAGSGNLTAHLCRTAKKVVAVEIDDRFIPVLENTFAKRNNCHIVHGDMLKIDPADILQHEEYIVVANIPYYITSALIRHLITSQVKPKRLILTIQYEVAERICAQSGKMSLLALSVQIFGNPSLLFKIKPGAFRPQPKVDSAVVLIDMYDQPLIETENLDLFFKIAKSGFGKKRKTLANSLSSGMKREKSKIITLLETAGINPMRRAETLTIPEWHALTTLWIQTFPTAIQ